MSVLSVSHTDLDGISCQFVLNETFGSITNMNISYGKIDEYLNVINDHCTRTNPEKVFITDLSFEYHQLEKLSEITQLHLGTHFYFIDHHPFEEEYSHLVRGNFTILITSKASATKLTYLFCKANFNLDNKDLLQYVEYVNAYDIWLEDTPEFKVGFVYNELFWTYRMNHYRNRFNGDYKLRNKDKEYYKELMVKKVKTFGKLEKSGKLFRLGDNDIFMVFTDDFRSHITIDYPDFKVYVIFSSYGTISVRLRDDIPNYKQMKENVVKKMEGHKNVISAGGHDKAFGITLNTVEPGDLILIAKELLGIIDNELDLQKG